MPLMRPRHAGVRTWLVLLGAASLIAAVLLASAHAQPPLETVAEPIVQQLEAFRRDDYDAAYAFASAQIRQLFDRRAFEQMVRGGYPEIARSTRVRIADTRLAPDGHVYVRMKIRGANGEHVEAVYEMVREDGAWKINGVVTRPDPGEEV
jgi:ABC-type transporter MlaC component